MSQNFRECTKHYVGIPLPRFRERATGVLLVNLFKEKLVSAGCGGVCSLHARVNLIQRLHVDILPQNVLLEPIFRRLGTMSNLPARWNREHLVEFLEGWV